MFQLTSTLLNFEMISGVNVLACWEKTYRARLVRLTDYPAQRPRHRKHFDFAPTFSSSHLSLQGPSAAPRLPASSSPSFKQTLRQRNLQGCGHPWQPFYAWHCVCSPFPTCRSLQMPRLQWVQTVIANPCNSSTSHHQPANCPFCVVLTVVKYPHDIP